MHIILLIKLKYYYTHTSGSNCGYFGRNVRSIPEENEKSSYNPVTRSVLSVDKLERLGWKANYIYQTGLPRTIEIMS